VPSGEEQQCAETCERLPAPTVVLAAPNERRVDADRDVVQEQPLGDSPDVGALLVPVGERVEGGDRVARVEADVACEVVASSVRDADEREIARDRRIGDRGQGASPPAMPRASPSASRASAAGSSPSTST
jgi:hypothetical protein